MCWPQHKGYILCNYFLLLPLFCFFFKDVDTFMKENNSDPSTRQQSKNDSLLLKVLDYD